MDNSEKVVYNGFVGEQVYEYTLTRWFDDRDVELLQKYGIEGYHVAFNEMRVCDIESLILLLKRKLNDIKNKRDNKLMRGVINGLISTLGWEYEEKVGGNV